MAHPTTVLQNIITGGPNRRGVIGTLQEFVQSSASSGIVLIAAAVAALIVVNIGFEEEYTRLLHTHLRFSIGDYELDNSLLHWINDGLMAIFFFLVGLEIKREILVGELSSFRLALLPIFAATGGAIVPAVLYTLFNQGSDGSAGWGIPMATDIAFTLGIVALLGQRVPFALKIFLTAIAIVDDLIAVLVIAFFYTNTLDWMALGIGIALLAFMLTCNFIGVRQIAFYLILGSLVWLAFYESGVHATIAGVLIAWTVPARNRIRPDEFAEESKRILAVFENSDVEVRRMLTDEEQQDAVLTLENLCEQVQAPLQRLEHILHNPVQFLVMPIFAFANMGVILQASTLTGENSNVALGILIGLVLGKPIGVYFSTLLSVKLKLTTLPQQVGWSHMLGAACLTGIGFTMSLFISSLAFGEGRMLETAKMGIMVASIVAALLGYIVLWRLKPMPDNE